MPALGAAGALLIRAIIQMIIQLGLMWLIERYIVPQIEKVVQNIMVVAGVPREEAEAIMANEIVQFAESVGVGVLVLKSKMPTKVAEKLGFTSKGFTKRKLSPKGEAVAKEVRTALGTKAAINTEAIAGAAATIAAKRGVSLALANEWASLLVKIVGVPVGVGLLVTNTIDFGAWSSSAYQTQFQKFLGLFGLEPDKATAAPRTTSKEVFDKVYTSFLNEGAIEINDPYKNAVVPYNRENLISIVDRLGSNIFIETGTVSAKQVLGAVLPLVHFKDGRTPAVATQATTGATSSPYYQPVRIFTGIISQGVVGEQIAFTPRQDDLIENIRELEDALHNNLAPFIASLAGRITHETKVVSSVTTKDGFKQTGTAQRIVSGYTGTGTPKYKTVVNKFAVTDIYIANANNGRTRLARIVLGPVDSVAFQPTQNDVNALALKVQKNIYTNKIADVSPDGFSIPVAQPAPLTGALLPSASAPERKILPDVLPAFPPDIFIPRDGFSGSLWRVVGDTLWSYEPTEILFTEDEKREFGNFGRQIEKTKQLFKERGVDLDGLNRVAFIADILSQYANKRFVSSNLEEFVRGETRTQEASNRPAAALNATTLSGYYSAQSLPLPSLAERAKLYEQLGLGLASYYTGTSEQNTKLLFRLQGKSL